MLRIAISDVRWLECTYMIFHVKDKHATLRSSWPEFWVHVIYIVRSLIMYVLETQWFKQDEAYVPNMNVFLKNGHYGIVVFFKIVQILIDVIW